MIIVRHFCSLTRLHWFLPRIHDGNKIDHEDSHRVDIDIVQSNWQMLVRAHQNQEEDVYLLPTGAATRRTLIHELKIVALSCPITVNRCFFDADSSDDVGVNLLS